MSDALSYNGYTARFPREVYQELISHAKNANPTPTQSGFYVRTAGMTESGKFVIGGNHEFGLDDGSHGEDTVIDAAKQQYPGDPLVLVGFYGGRPGHCGNCRDRLKEFLAPGAETLAADSVSLENLAILPFHKTFLKEDFSSYNTFTLAESDAIAQARWAMDMSYNIYLVEEDKKKVYGTALITPAGIFAGGFEGCVAFDPTLPMRSAAVVMMYSSNNKDRFRLQSAVITSRQKPHVLYKDRQQIGEFVERMSYIGGSRPLPIKLVELDAQNTVACAWQTDTDEWMPRPFTPSRLGMDDVVERHSRRLLQE